MYFVLLDRINLKATFHFDTISALEELECFKNMELKEGQAWLEDDNGDRVFAHYDEADAILEFLMLDEDVKYSKLFCHQCFREVEEELVASGLEVNVVFFAEGCVDPEILITMDEELARFTYLKHDRGATDEDLITWMQVPIKMRLEEKS